MQSSVRKGKYWLLAVKEMDQCMAIGRSDFSIDTGGKLVVVFKITVALERKLHRCIALGEDRGLILLLLMSGLTI